MKKLVFALGLVLPFYAFAEDRPVAEADVVQELKEYCQEIAEEDKPANQDMSSFVLECVNEELESMGYQPIQSL